MPETEYSTKLKDPRWQKKRLEIFERDGWECQLCGDKDSTLVVHHRDYLRDKEPWDYPNSLLVTLCEDCHAIEADRSEIEQSIIHDLRAKFYTNDLSILEDGFEKLPDCDPSESWMIAETIRWFLTTPDVMEEMSNRLRSYMNQAK